MKNIDNHFHSAGTTVRFADGTEEYFPPAHWADDDTIVSVGRKAHIERRAGCRGREAGRMEIIDLA